MNRTPLKLTALAMALGLALGAQAERAALRGQGDAVARLTADAGADVKITLHDATGAARFVRLGNTANRSLVRGPRALGDAARHADSSAFLANYGGLFGITNLAGQLDAGTVARDAHGGTHITHKQFHQGVPVFGAELKSHFDRAGNLTSVNGTFIPDITVKTQPGFSAAKAAAVALARVKADLTRPVATTITTAQPALLVYREGLVKGIDGASRLVWQIEVGNRVDVRDFVFVDAHSGKVVEKFAGMHDAKNRRAFDGAGATQPGPNYPNNPFWVEGQALPTGTVEADNMVAASGEIYDLFKNAFGRDSFNGKGATMDSVFNRGNGCPNASWNGVYISFCPGLTTDDVTAHEWAHAYTEYTHGLIYAWQPGALNEAYSDIWGETVDRLNGRGGDTPDAARTAGSCTAFTNSTLVNVTAPAVIAGAKTSFGAAFGPQTFSVAATQVVVVNDGDASGSGTTDACQSPFVNAAAVAGKIAFVDRGACGFAVKVKNAQLNGAIGVIVGNNASALGNMGGADATITIPSLMISQADGTAIKAQSGVQAILQRGPGSDNSVRWLLGEDSTAPGLTGALRDMYNPVCRGNPGKVSDTQYSCGPNTQAGDNGGVHTNSGVPNHAYALLVDGGAYNGQNIGGIGLTKAAHIYYRAQSVYQGPASGFPEHADAIEQSCADLTGVNLKDLKTGAPSGEVISASDCAEVAKATLAVEMRTPPAQCSFTTLLAKAPPALCTSGSPTVIASDNFEGGKRNSLKWLLSNAGTGDVALRNWGVVSKLPGGRAGLGIFSANADVGNCSPGGDASGVQRLDSPEITIPVGTAVARMAFDHYVATESGFDGGNVKISVNGGAWQLVKASDFIYNGYNATLATTVQGNTNPLAGQPAFTGTDAGSVTGSWGRSIVNLAPYAVAGDKIKLRFETGQDGCGGVTGWYLDDLSVYSCAAPAP